MLHDKFLFCLYSGKKKVFFFKYPLNKCPCLWPESIMAPVRVLNSVIYVWNHLSMAKSGASFKSAKFYKDAKIAIASVCVCMCILINLRGSAFLLSLKNKERIMSTTWTSISGQGQKGNWLMVGILSKVFQMMPNN